MISLSLSDLYELAFNYKSKAFDPQFEEQDPKRDALSPYANYEGAKGGKYWGINANTGLEYYMPVKLGGIELHHPVIRTDARKHIIQTNLIERNGTVKELISIDDWSIVIRGIIVSKNKEFPEDEVEELKDLFNRNEALSIDCPITNILWVMPEGELAEMVITDFSFPEVRGVKGVRGYEIRGISDTSFDLEKI
jgi:hypothetical protein